jgi:glycosyltransferase involved in cell wall biosynthesis
MKVYLTGAPEHMDVRVGFGNASYHIYNTLKNLGVDVHIKKLNDRTPYEADVEIAFDQPQNYKFMCPTSYKIGYTPWESTEFMPNWYKPMRECDELWTTSEWCYNIFKQKLPDKEIFVYNHGIDHAFRPKKRKYSSDRPFTFLFIGEPYWRKDGDLVARTFAKLYGDNPDYRLIIKGTGMHTIKIKDKTDSYYGSPEALYDNIIAITDYLKPEQVVELYAHADVFVYPTWGEGFGFNPLQALAMGIPVISTYAWSDYSDYITVPIESSFFPSPWPEIHPGFMMKPDHKHLELAMKVAKDMHEKWCGQAFLASLEIHKEYDWVKVTEPAVARLEKIFSSLELKS